MITQILQRYDSFQIAELDDDMVGMCKAFTDWLIELSDQLGQENIPSVEPPDAFYKLNPHQPKMELRRNYRRFLSFAVRRQDESLSISEKLTNIYIAVIAGMYIFHMPVDKMIERSKTLKELSREDAKKMLLEDKMSPNWLKEPSGKDFSAIML